MLCADYLIITFIIRKEVDMIKIFTYYYRTSLSEILINLVIMSAKVHKSMIFQR